MMLNRHQFFKIASFAIAVVFLVLTIVGATLGEITAVKGSYVLIGLLLAVGIYTTSVRTGDQLMPNFPNKRLGKGVHVVLLVGILSTLLAGNRLFVLFLCLPLGYALVALQLVSDPMPKRVLPQITGLFIISTLTRYLTTGMYFGNGDTLKHVGYIDRLVATGEITVLSRYVEFPGLHLLIGTVDILTGLAPYDALLLVGIITYSLLVPLIYLLAVTISANPRLSLFIATALTGLESLSIFSTYFFPQSLAVALLLFLLYVSYRWRDWSESRAITFALALPISGAAVITHHFTFIIFVPVLAIVLFAPTILARFRPTKVIGRATVRPTPLPLLIGWGAAVIHWIVFTEFLDNFLWSVGVVFSNTLLADDVGKPAQLYTYGFELPPPTIESAFISLASPTGIYAIVLVALVTVAVAASTPIVAHQSVQRSFAVLLAGFVITPLVLPTPIALPSADRFRLVAIFFFAFLIGLSFYVLSPYNLPTAPSSTAVLVVVVVALGTSGAVVAADDVRQGRTMSGLTDLQPSPGPQVSFSDREYSALRQTSGFVRQHKPNASTFWITRWTLGRFGADASADVDISRHALTAKSDTFLYRNRWPQYEVLEVSEGGLSYSSMRFSEGFLARKVKVESKIYTTGETGLLWGKSNRSASENSTDQTTR